MEKFNTSGTDKVVGGFIIGCAFMFIIGLIIIAIVTSVDENVEIRSTKKIQPEWQLTTDGKKIDTVYIYKQK